MSENDNIRKLQELYAAFGRGDVAAIVSNCSEDVDWGTETVVQEIPWYRIRHGHDGVADFFTTLANEVDFEKFEPNLWAAAGDQVLVGVDYIYRFKKNSRSAAAKAIHKFTVRDGQVTQFRAYEDTAMVRDAWNE